MTRQYLFDFIRQYRYGVLSTISPDNTPQSACIGFAATPDLKLIFDTISDSRKYKNLLINKNISFVIGCDNEQTIQYEGIAKIPELPELDKLLQTYFAVFPDGKERMEQWKNIAYFCLEPKWIRFSDFSKEAVQLDEMIFPSD
jgi:uncharacterized pyridoxamine 5'-phosphate oxidase family protein